MRNALRKRISKGMMAIAALLLIGQIEGSVAQAQEPTWTLKDVEKVCAEFKSKFGTLRLIDYTYTGTTDGQITYTAPFAPLYQGCVTDTNRITFFVQRVERQKPVYRPSFDWVFQLEKVEATEYRMRRVQTNCVHKAQMNADKLYEELGYKLTPEIKADVVKSAAEQQCPALQKAVWDAILRVTQP
jgi:hypothetical protein